jgi:hypothetical protein
MKKITEERCFLDEARLNYRKKPNFNAKTFFMEVEGGMSYIERAKSNPDMPLFCTGIVQTGDKPNRNGRIYPFQYLKRECMRYMENEVRSGTSYGELDHPENSTSPALSNASHTIEDIWFKGNDVYAKIKILNAFMPDRAPGKMARGFLLNGKSIGISSRALGSLEEDNNSDYDVVAEDLEMICWDLVSNASNYGSEKVDLVMEGKGKKRPALLTESQCFGPNCNIKNKDFKFQELSESEKTFVKILGVEKFLQIAARNKR